MSKYDFLLANMNDASEIMDIYHSLIGTQGCTWSLEYPDNATVQSDIECD